MDIEVPIGEIKVTNGKDNLIASGIGSCLVIILYDSKQRIGALAHAMLSLSAHSAQASSRRVKRIANRENKDYTLYAKRYLPSANEPDTRYIDTALDEMLKKMEAQGAKRNNIEAKLIGGANMFSAFTSNIGENNISCAKEELKKLGIAIAGECVGGSQGRSVEFAVASGIVTVKTNFEYTDRRGLTRTSV